jgi:hypothetical protein
MATFPILTTGAVAQYPAKYTINYRADVVSFLDGSEQRFRNAPSLLYQWEIDLSQLDEQEIASFQQFFVSNQGASNVFSFNDPWTNITYPNCSLVSDNMNMNYVGLASGKTSVVIRQNRV